MIILLLSALLLITNIKAEECPVQFCNGTQPSHEEVEKFCQREPDESHMIGRCCINKTDNAVIGLDLSSCDIQSLNISESNFTDVVIMDLRDNKLQSLVPNDLIGLINLNYLYLPNKIPCPGGKQAWNDTEFNDTFCHLQRNPCYYLNISCTDNGVCIHLGPGSAKCICKTGHYGYKCLNEGEFPITAFSVSLTVSVVVLSILLWFAQGRDAYKKR